MGLFDRLRRDRSTPEPPPVTVAPPVQPEPPAPAENVVKKIRPYVREMYDGMNLVYQYSNIKFSMRGNFSLAMGDMEAADKWNVDLVLEDDKVFLTYKATKIGTLLDRVDMVKDFLKRNDVVLAWVETNSTTDNTLLLAFYRDERKHLERRESQIVKLTRYANQEAQDCMTGLEPGYRLDFDPNYDYNAPEDTVFILCGGAIGALPKKQSRRYLEEGAAAVFVERIEYDDEKDKDIPYVKIYW